MEVTMIENGIIKIRKNRYPLSKIVAVDVRHLSVKDQLIRISSLGIQLSTVGWVSPLFLTSHLAAYSCYFSILLFLIGVIFGFASFRTHELRVTFRAVDETGEQTTTIMKTCKKSRVSELHKFAEAINTHI
jgi:hypothetical protein